MDVCSQSWIGWGIGNLWSAWFWVSKACTRPAPEKGCIRHLNTKLHTSNFRWALWDPYTGQNGFFLSCGDQSRSNSCQRAVMVTFLLKLWQSTFSCSDFIQWFRIKKKKKVFASGLGLSPSSPEHPSRLWLGYVRRFLHSAYSGLAVGQGTARTKFRVGGKANTEQIL